MTPRPATDHRAGVALVAVLGALLIVATIVFATAFLATLDVRAARSSQTSVLAEAQAEGALDAALADLAEIAAAASAGTGDGSGDGSVDGAAAAPPTDDLGPWPSLGLSATVSVSTMAETWGSGVPVVALSAEARVGASRGRARAVVALTAPPTVLYRP